MILSYEEWVCDTVMAKYLPHKAGSHQLMTDLSGVLINSDSVLDYPRLLPESFINVAGLQIQKEQSPLPPVNHSRFVFF